MMGASEADEAWCPPTFTPSIFSRRWLAWWMVQLASHSTFFSSSPRIASSFALGLVLALSAMGTVCSALCREAKRGQPPLSCRRHAREGGHQVTRVGQIKAAALPFVQSRDYRIV